MHRQLRAERNFSSYPWVDVFDSPVAAAGGAQADTAPSDNARPRHSAPNRLVPFIRSPPPSGPLFRCDTPPAYRPGRRSAHPKREYGGGQWQKCGSSGGSKAAWRKAFSYSVGVARREPGLQATRPQYCRDGREGSPESDPPANGAQAPRRRAESSDLTTGAALLQRRCPDALIPSFRDTFPPRRLLHAPRWVKPSG